MSLKNFIKQTEESYYLEKVTFLTLIPETSFRQTLTKLYNAPKKDQGHRLAATILNAIYTEGKTTFLLSNNKLLKLIKSDKSNLEYRGRYGLVLGKNNVRLTYLRQECLQIMEEAGLIKIINKTRDSQFEATIVDLIDEEVFDMMNEQGRLTKYLKRNWRESVVNVGRMMGQIQGQTEGQTPGQTVLNEMNSLEYPETDGLISSNSLYSSIDSSNLSSPSREGDLSCLENNLKKKEFKIPEDITFSPDEFNTASCYSQEEVEDDNLTALGYR